MAIISDLNVMEFSVPFKPTFAFPLDNREYFESYEAALAKAQTAIEVGGSTSNYYYGQVLRVVENGVAALYQIQPDNTLSPVGGGAALDAINERVGKVEENVGTVTDLAAEIKERVDAFYNPDGVLAALTSDVNTLKGRADALEGRADALEGRADALEGRADDLEEAVNGIDDKIAVAIAAANHLKFQIAESKEAIDLNAELADTYIYLVAKAGEGDDVYDEYMIINGSVELIGHTKVDLTEYAKTADIEAAYVKKEAGKRLLTDAEGEKLAAMLEIKDVSDELLLGNDGMLGIQSISMDKVTSLLDEMAKKVDKEDGKRLMSDDEGEKLAAMLRIESVSDEFVVGDDRMLVVGAIDKSKITGLADEMAKKVDKVEGSRLITELEAQKIEKLVLNDDGSVGLSGTVNAENVQGLANLLAGKVDKAEGSRLMLDTEGTKLAGIEDGAQVNVIESIKIGGVALEIADKAVEMPVAGAMLGLVKGSDAENGVAVNEAGEMTVNSLNVNKLVQTEGEDLILNGGSAQG